MRERILVVEDDEFLRDTLQTELELAGYEVAVAADAAAAIDLSRQEPFALIVTDVRLRELKNIIIKYLPSFSHVIPAVVGHHERWDGTGYPRRIKGENIPFAARCIAVADAFDAITSNRHYKTYLSIDFALEEVENNAGKQFDPELAKIFVHLVRSGQLIIEPSRSTEAPKTTLNLYQ